MNLKNLKQSKKDFIVKGSGKVQKFKTGSIRDTNLNKGRFDLIPFYSIWELAKHFEKGANRYKDNNWRLGQPLSRYFDSCQRHLAKLAMGWEDEGKDFHLTAACWNLLAFMETKKRIELKQLPQELNDFPYVKMEENE